VDIPKFPYNRVYGKGAVPKTSSIRPVVSILYRLVKDRQTDGQTDRRTHDDSIYRASIGSRGKKTKDVCLICYCIDNTAHSSSDVVQAKALK